MIAYMQSKRKLRVNKALLRTAFPQLALRVAFAMIAKILLRQVSRRARRYEANSEVRL